MPVYALYIPTASEPVTGIRMERFASRELTGRVLLVRNATKRSRTFYFGGKAPVRVGDHPEADFFQADSTGYMRVFLRMAADPVPQLGDTPDEEWIVEKGGRQGKVVRLPWTSTRERIRVDRRTNRLSVTPFFPLAQPATLAVMRIDCYRKDCNRAFEAKTVSRAQFIALYRRHGWKMRGWVTGAVYFCEDHDP